MSPTENRPSDEIEITPEMIAAGEAAYLRCSSDFFTPSEAAEAVYLAMRQALKAAQ